MHPDDVYGPCLPPDRPIRPHEWTGRPSMVRQLNHETGKWLARYMESVPAHEIHETLAGTTAILWVMDDDQQVFFALEEVRAVADNTIHCAYPRLGIELPEELIKFGHPSLLPPATPNSTIPREKWARCAGDIRFDRDLGKDSPWVVTFESGRYGTRDYLEESKIAAIARLFADNSVLLSPYV